jgi:hypothetical protein
MAHVVFTIVFLLVLTTASDWLSELIWRRLGRLGDS